MYPTFVLWWWQYNTCNNNCKDVEDYLAKICCQWRCYYVEAIHLFILTTNDDGSVAKSDINTTSLIASFLLSVGNDTRWAPVVTNSVQRCYDDLYQSKEGKLFCDILPKTLYSVIDCTYNENFLKCPVWNPHNLIECEYTYKYVEKCSDLFGPT